MKKLNVILIDPYDQSISRVDIDGSLESIYKVLQCRLIDIMNLGENIDLIMDDEGRLNSKNRWFAWGGNSFAGRVSSSLLHVLDLKELITTNIEQYENLAIELASNKIHMQSIRSRLNENLKIKPLFDCKKFTTNLEKAYLEVHRLYYQNNKVDNIEV